MMMMMMIHDEDDYDHSDDVDKEELMIHLPSTTTLFSLSLSLWDNGPQTRNCLSIKSLDSHTVAP